MRTIRRTSPFLVLSVSGTQAWWNKFIFRYLSLLITGKEFGPVCLRPEIFASYLFVQSVHAPSLSWCTKVRRYRLVQDSLSQIPHKGVACLELLALSDPSKYPLKPAQAQLHEWRWWKGDLAFWSLTEECV